METRIGLAALVLVLLAGCGIAQRRQEREAHTQRMNDLIGKSVDDLVRSEGPPTSSFALTQGGAVFEYSRSRQVGSGGGSITAPQSTLVAGTWVSVPQQRALPSSSATLTCKMLVTLTPAWRVEGWKQEGNDC